MPFCQNCGNQIPDGAPMCPTCGMPAAQNQTASAQTQVVQMPQQEKKKKNKGCLIAALAVIIIGIIGAAGAAGGKNRDEGKVTVGSSGSAGTAQSTGQSGQKDFAYEITDTQFHYYQNSINRTEYYGFIEITNTGTKNIYLKDCTFDLEDNDGHLLQTDSLISSCPDIIAPGEKGYFYNNLISTSVDEGVSLDNGIKLCPTYKIEEAKGDIVEYAVSDTDMRSDDNGTIKVTGRVTNNTTEDDSLLYVNILLLDQNGKVLLITGTNVLDLTAGTTQSFEASTMFSDDTVKPEQVASYKVIARKTHYQF